MAAERKERRKGGWLKRLTSEGPRDREELLESVRAAARANVIDGDAMQMIQGVLRVGDQHVRDIMVPRSQMVVLERDTGPQQLLPAVIESGHSRFPVIGEDRDQVVGILLAKDLLRYFAEGATAAWDVRDVLRPAAFVPESKRLNVLLKEFRASRNHMAIVVDEYGGVSGLVTIEDVIEEIVGEIADEYDTDEDQTIRREGDRQFAVQAHALREGTLGARARRRLQQSADFDELVLLGECDRGGRVPGVEVPDLDEALEYLRDLAKMCG